MFDVLSQNEFVSLADSHTRIAVYKEIPGDRLTPVNALFAIRKKAQDVTLLESNPKEKEQARYSHVCFDAVMTIEACGHDVTMSEDEKITTVHDDPFHVLRKLQSEFDCHVCHPLSGYAGGFVGFMSYDAVRLIEALPDNHANQDDIPDIFFRYYKNHITFDHQTGKVIVTTVAKVGSNPIESYQHAMSVIDNLCEMLFSPSQGHPNTLMLPSTANTHDIQVDTSLATYSDMVAKAKAHIAEGDIFQIVLSREFSVEVTTDAFDIYRALRYSNPSPYMFYIQADGYVVTGASPEKLVSLKKGVIESCPLAGTRPRQGENDALVAKELLNSAKEVAEHMMLVDLARNDLGRVSVPGTVTVKKLKEIEQYARVMHISSTVEGDLGRGFDAWDVLKAAFPAGTLSGAPKIKAMELIDRLEQSRRGLYGGAVCAIDAKGDLDSCIVIRTAVIKDNTAYVRAGAGIVYDSSPKAEADETYHKAKAVLEGILQAEGALT